MTTGILLGTAQEHKAVCAVAAECDFRHSWGEAVYVHKTIEDLRLQIHGHAAHFPDVENIITQVEFDDLTGRFPDNPLVVEALRKLYTAIPDLLYKTNDVLLGNLKPAKPLSEYIAELEKKEKK